MKTLFKIVLLTMCVSTLGSCEKLKKDKTPSNGEITGFHISETDYKSVTFTLDIKKATDPEDFTVGVVLSRYGDPMEEEISKVRSESKRMTDDDGNGHYEFSVYNLVASTTYRARAYISDPNGNRVWSDDMLSFITDPAKVPVCVQFAVTPTSATNIRYESRWDNRGFTISEYGFEYATSQSNLESTTGSKIKHQGSGGSITGLTPGATYYARAYAKNSEGTGYTPCRTFTMPAEPEQECTVFDVFPSSTAIYAQCEWEGGDIVEKGLIYSTTESSPNISTGTKYPDASVITDLKAGASQHFVRAYAKNNAGQIVYSGTKTVKASSSVNLGLSVNWASVNVGSSSVTGYGNYFMWGHKEQKSTYTWENYDYYNSSKLTKYTPEDHITTLTDKDDAAYAKMGSGWHTPTAAEWNELIAGCDITWITLDGINGCKVKSKKTGNCIFLPAGGSYGDSGNSTKGIQCAYWTADVNASGTIYMYAKFFSYHIENGKAAVSDYGYRYGGRSVRAVNR